jgi:predicted RND superfamily exporter protein
LINVFSPDGDKRKEEQFAIDAVMSSNSRYCFALYQFRRKLLEGSEHIVILNSAQQLIEETKKKKKKKEKKKKKKKRKNKILSIVIIF